MGGEGRGRGEGCVEGEGLVEGKEDNPGGDEVEDEEEGFWTGIDEMNGIRRVQVCWPAQILIKVLI